jgi:hypothetical protein
MKAFETTTTVVAKGDIRLIGLPFAPGTEVEGRSTRSGKAPPNLSTPGNKSAGRCAVSQQRKKSRTTRFRRKLKITAPVDDYVITGDNDLLQAKISVPTRLISPSDFAADFGVS